MAPVHPEVAYAERCNPTEAEKNIIYFTIHAPDIQGEPTLEITPTEIKFRAKAGNPEKGLPAKEYSFDLDLYAEIIPEETKKVTTSRAITLILRKKEMSSEYWLRLTKEKPNRNWVKTDFAKWVDEDEQDGEAPDLGGQEDPMGGMGGMMGGGGMPGMGGMGGMGGMEAMMGGMGGGMGGAGGMDFSKLMAQMGQGGMGGMGGGMPGMGGMDDDEDSGDDDEEEEADVKGKGKAKADLSLEDVE